MKNDPKTYRKMLEPYESIEECEKQIKSFFDEVAELRKKYKVPQVLLVVEATVLKDGDEGAIQTLYEMGNFLTSEYLAAYALGTLKAQRVERLAHLAAGERH